MKLTTTLAATFTALTFVIVGCDDKKAAVPHDHDGDGKPDHGPEAHGKPVPHDHDGDGKPDHADGAHDKADPHAGHDHAQGEHKGPDHGNDAHAGHSHAEKVAGPNGGKIITNVEPHAEFFVTAERKVRITFLDDDNKAIAVANQSASIVCGDRSNPTTLTLAKEAYGMSLVSDITLPAGNNFPTIVSIKTSPEAQPVRSKFALNLTDCPSCKYKEYACICDHGH